MNYTWIELFEQAIDCGCTKEQAQEYADTYINYIQTWE